MRKWTKTSSLLFLAAASVYSVGALSVGAEKQVSSANGAIAATEVKLLDEASAATLLPPTTKPAE